MESNTPLARMIRAALAEAVRPPEPNGKLSEAIRAVARSRETVYPFPEPGQALPLGDMLRARHQRDK